MAGELLAGWLGVLASHPPPQKDADKLVNFERRREAEAVLRVSMDGQTAGPVCSFRQLQSRQTPLGPCKVGANWQDLFARAAEGILRHLADEDCPPDFAEVSPGPLRLSILVPLCSPS